MGWMVIIGRRNSKSTFGVDDISFPRIRFYWSNCCFFSFQTTPNPPSWLYSCLYGHWHCVCLAGEQIELRSVQDARPPWTRCRNLSSKLKNWATVIFSLSFLGSLQYLFRSIQKRSRQRKRRRWSGQSGSPGLVWTRGGRKRNWMVMELWRVTSRQYLVLVLFGLRTISTMESTESLRTRTRTTMLTFSPFPPWSSRDGSHRKEEAIRKGRTMKAGTQLLCLKLQLTPQKMKRQRWKKVFRPFETLFNAITRFSRDVQYA